MTRTIFFISIALLFVSSCKKEEAQDVQTKEITISSQTLGTVYYYSYGYSFEKTEFIPTLGTNEIIDIYLVETTKITGELTGTQFATKEIPESIEQERTQINSRKDHIRLEQGNSQVKQRLQIIRCPDLFLT